MHAVASINTPDYQDLADLTDATKIEYCNRYGYQFFVLKETKYSSIMGFNKIHFVRDIFNQNSDLDWLLFSESDAMITNMTISMPEKFDSDYHFIIPVDRLNLNAGNFLVRNSAQGRDYLDMILSKESDYLEEPWAEQQVIIDTIEDYQDIVKIVPQRYMNSYEPHIYDYCDASLDIFGNSGAWQQGDWIVHWPGTYKPNRINRAMALTPLIIR